jgi:hypothetical protein
MAFIPHQMHSVIPLKENFFFRPVTLGIMAIMRKRFLFIPIPSSAVNFQIKKN